MLKTFALSALLVGSVAASAAAQNTLTTTQTPPSPNASSITVNPANSLPSGAASATQVRPGADVGTTRTAPASGTVQAAPVAPAPVR